LISSSAAFARNLLNRVERKFIDPQRVLAAQGALRAARKTSGGYQHLWDAELSVFSQFGEDGILDFLCDQLEISKPRVLEIGAGDFLECNSRFLVEARGASLYAVDGAAGLLKNIQRSPLMWKTSVLAEEAWVTPDNMSDISRRAREFMGGIDIFSLDIDGNDYWVLKSLDLSGVAIAVIEYNPVFGPTRALSVPRDDRFDRSSAHWTWQYYGMSLRALLTHMSDECFTFVGTNRSGNNAFFVRDSLVGRVEIELPDSSSTANLAMYTDWRVRDSRGEDGGMSYETPIHAAGLLRGLPVYNLDTAEVESF